MPFLQPSLIKKISDMPVKLRSNGRLFREIIFANSPQLKKFNLAKGTVTQPFFFNSLQSRIWSMVNKKMNMNKYIDNKPERMLKNLKEFITDSANSKNVKESGIYNYSKVMGIIENYYNGKKEFQSRLDWWLSFELFRKQIANVD